jgi:hypothetical protein
MSENRSLAVLEVLVHLSGTLPDKYLVGAAGIPQDVAVERIADHELPKGWSTLSPGEQVATRRLEDAGVRRQRSAVLAVPSVILGERSFLAKPIGSRPNDTPIDHKPVQICDVRPAGDFISYMFEDRKVDPAEAFFWAAICKPDAIAVLRSARGMSDDAHTSSRSRQDFGAFGNDNVNLFSHFLSRF